MTSPDFEIVKQAKSLLRGQEDGRKFTLRLVEGYDVGNLSEKVVRIILSYGGYVNLLVCSHEL